MGGRWLRYLVIVFILALATYGALSFWPAIASLVGPALPTVVPTAALIEVPGVISAIPDRPIGQIPLPANTEPLPTVTGAEVALVRPNPGASFLLSDFLAFVWRWPEPLAAGQWFTLYVQAGEQEFAAGLVTTPTSRDFYTLQVVANLVAAADGVYYWQVRLEDAATGDTLAYSPIWSFHITRSGLADGPKAPARLPGPFRPATALPLPTLTPLPITTQAPAAATATPRPTDTATATATLPLPTPRRTVWPTWTPTARPATATVPPPPTNTPPPPPTNTLPPPPPTVPPTATPPLPPTPTPP